MKLNVKDIEFQLLKLMETCAKHKISLEIVTSPAKHKVLIEIASKLGLTIEKRKFIYVSWRKCLDILTRYNNHEVGKP